MTTNRDIRAALQMVRTHQAWKWVGSAAAGNMLPVAADRLLSSSSPSSSSSSDHGDVESVASAESAFQSLNRLMGMHFGGEIQLRWFARRFVRLFTGTPRITRTAYREAIQLRLSRLRGRASSHPNSNPSFPSSSSSLSTQEAAEEEEEEERTQHARRLRELLREDFLESSAAAELQDPLPRAQQPESSPRDIPRIGINRLQFHHFLHSLHHRAKLGLWYRWDDFGRIFELFDEDDTGLIDFKQYLLYLRVTLFGGFDERLRLLFEIYDRHSLSCLTEDALQDMEELLLETIADMHAAIPNPPSQTRGLDPKALQQLLEDDPGKHPERKGRIFDQAFDRLELGAAVRSIQRLFRDLRASQGQLLDFCTFRRAVLRNLVFRCGLSCGPVPLRPAYEPIPPPTAAVKSSTFSSSPASGKAVPVTSPGPAPPPPPAAGAQDTIIIISGGDEDEEEDEEDDDLDRKMDPARWGRRLVDLNQPELCQVDLWSMLEAAVDVLPVTLPLGAGVGGGQIQLRFPPIGGSPPAPPVQRDSEEFVPRVMNSSVLDDSSSSGEEEGTFLEDVFPAARSPRRSRKNLSDPRKGFSSIPPSSASSAVAFPSRSPPPVARRKHGEASKCTIC